VPLFLMRLPVVSTNPNTPRIIPRAARMWADTFNRTDNAINMGSTNLGSRAPQAWKTIGSGGAWGIQDSRAKVTAGSTAMVTYLTHDQASYRVRATLAAVRGSTVARVGSLVFRLSSINDFFFVTTRYDGTNSYGLVKKEGNVNFNIASFDRAPAAGDVVEVFDNTVSGRIEVRVNGIPQHTSTSSTMASNRGVGLLGQFTSDPITAWDDFDITPQVALEL
jgi:hypothetical protein